MSWGQARLEDLETVEERMEQKQRDKLRRSWDADLNMEATELWRDFMGKRMKKTGMNISSYLRINEIFDGDIIWELHEIDKLHSYII
jgi:hypothetical protein